MRGIRVDQLLLLGLDGRPDYSLRAAYVRASPYVVRDEQSQLLSVEEWPLLRVLSGEVLTDRTAVDVIIRARDGREIQLNVSGAPVSDQDGQIGGPEVKLASLGTVIVIRDVTERRRLEHRTHQALRALLSIAQVIVQGEDTGDAPDEQTSPSARVIAQRLAELTREVLGCERLSFTVVEEGMEILRLLAVVGLSREQEQQWWAEQEKRLLDDPDRSLVARLRAGEVSLIDMRQPPWNSQPNPYGIRVFLLAPMCIGHHLVGLLSLDDVASSSRIARQRLQAKNRSTASVRMLFIVPPHD